MQDWSEDLSYTMAKQNKGCSILKRGGGGGGRPKHNSEFGGKGRDNLEFVRRVPGYVDLGEGGRKDRNLSSESQKSIFLGIRNW